MSEEFILRLGAVYHLGLVVFHLLFWRIFRWPQSLACLGWVDRAVMQVLNLALIFLFLILAGLSWFFVDELLATDLGRALLLSIAMLWLFRSILQVVYFDLRHPASQALFLVFMIGVPLYLSPLLSSLD